jgi:hypothetical protein
VRASGAAGAAATAFDIEHTLTRQAWYNSDVKGNRAYVLNNKERWFELAELAATEEDPKRLMDLIAEINRLLDEKHKRLDRLTPKPSE